MEPDEPLDIEIPGSPKPRPRYDAAGALVDPSTLIEKQAPARAASAPLTGSVLRRDGWHVRDREAPVDAAHTGVEWSTRTAAQARAAGVQRAVLCSDGWHVPGR